MNVFEVSDPPTILFATCETIFMNLIFQNFCAKRSLRPSGSQNKMFRVSVRSFVRSFGVRIFGDFCEADMRGGHMPLNGEVLKHRF